MSEKCNNWGIDATLHEYIIQKTKVLFLIGHLLQGGPWKIPPFYPNALNTCNQNRSSNIKSDVSYIFSFNSLLILLRHLSLNICSPLISYLFFYLFSKHIYEFIYLFLDLVNIYKPSQTYQVYLAWSSDDKTQTHARPLKKFGNYFCENLDLVYDKNNK